MIEFPVPLSCLLLFLNFKFPIYQLLLVRNESTMRGERHVKSTGMNNVIDDEMECVACFLKL